MLASLLDVVSFPLTWVAGLLLSSLFLYSHYERSFFTRRGVKSIKSYVPFVGDFKNVLMRREHFGEYISRNYNAYPNQRYVGLRLLHPILMITDLDLIKKLSIEDFDHFQDHLGNFNDGPNQLFGNNLFVLRGQKWRDMRFCMSPVFTTIKLKNMFHFVKECAERTTDYLAREMLKPENKDRGYIEVDMKDIITRYTNDVIASIAFGFEMNSFEDLDNEFYRMGKLVTNIGTSQFIKYVASVKFPNLLKMLNLDFFKAGVSEYFSELFRRNIRTREEFGINRPDLIELLMKHMRKQGSLAQKEDELGQKSDGGHERTKWSDIEIAAQALLFFIGGYDTSSILQCFMAQELMVNQAVQRRLQREVDGVLAQKSGASGADYAELLEMEYMDMVVSETLRLWPPAIATDRCCVKPYTLPPPSQSHDTCYKLNVGDGVFIPIFAIHRDPRLHPQPNTFDPERFSKTNRSKMKPYSYIPFGSGPRHCIARRFALLETKVIMFQILSKYDIVRSPRSQDPLELKKSAFTHQAANGIWIGLKPRI